MKRGAAHLRCAGGLCTVQRPALRLNEPRKTVAHSARESHETKIRKYIIIIEVKVVSYYESLNSSSGTFPCIQKQLYYRYHQ
jgi:hypothetical protein